MERVSATPTLSFVGASAAVLETDGFACLDSTGKLVTPAVGTGLTVSGLIQEGGTGDNATVFVVDRVKFVLANNDTTDAVTAASLNKAVYVFDAHTVSSDSTGTSVAGIARDIKGTKILVEIL